MLDTSLGHKVRVSWRPWSHKGDHHLTTSHEEEDLLYFEDRGTFMCWMNLFCPDDRKECQHDFEVKKGGMAFCLMYVACLQRNQKRKDALIRGEAIPVWSNAGQWLGLKKKREGVVVGEMGIKDRIVGLSRRGRSIHCFVDLFNDMSLIGWVQQ